MFFAEGGKGRVEDCKIWGNKLANVGIHDSGTQAVVKGCECANAWARPATLFLFCSGERFTLD